MTRQAGRRATGRTAGRAGRDRCAPERRRAPGPRRDPAPRGRSPRGGAQGCRQSTCAGSPPGAGPADDDLAPGWRMPPRPAATRAADAAARTSAGTSNHVTSLRVSASWAAASTVRGRSTSTRSWARVAGREHGLAAHRGRRTAVTIGPRRGRRARRRSGGRRPRESPAIRPRVPARSGQRRPAASSPPSTRSRPPPSGSASTSSALRRRRTAVTPRAAARVEAPAPPRPPDHDRQRHRRRAQNAPERRPEQPTSHSSASGRNTTWAAPRPTARCQTPASSRSPPISDDVFPAGRWAPGKVGCEVGSDQDKRRAGPGATRRRDVRSDLQLDVGGRREPQQVVQDLAVGGDEERANAGAAGSRGTPGAGATSARGRRRSASPAGNGRTRRSRAESVDTAADFARVVDGDRAWTVPVRRARGPTPDMRRPPPGGRAGVVTRSGPGGEGSDRVTPTRTPTRSIVYPDDHSGQTPRGSSIRVNLH